MRRLNAHNTIWTPKSLVDAQKPVAWLSTAYGMPTQHKLVATGGCPL
ncbi:hypothetical protein [Muribaculum intestinale]|nr:hypothetical protein [Muribaculum intestinale]